MDNQTKIHRISVIYHLKQEIYSNYQTLIHLSEIKILLQVIISIKIVSLSKLHMIHQDVHEILNFPIDVHHNINDSTRMGKHAIRINRLYSLKLGSQKSMDTVLSSTEFPNQQSSSLETNHLQQRSYWIRSNKSSSCKDCIITSSSLFCAQKSLDKNTHSITVEHNEELR